MLTKIIRGRKIALGRKFATSQHAHADTKAQSPLIQALMSPERIERHNREIELELAHVDRREQLLVEEYARKLGANAWSVKLSGNRLVATEGIRTDDMTLENKVDLKNNYRFEQSFDYPLVFIKAIRSLNDAEMWKADKFRSELFDHNVKNGLEYIEIMTEAEDALLNENQELKLGANEIRVVNLPADCSIRELKDILGVKARQIKQVTRDQMNNISSITLELANPEMANKFLVTNSEKYHNGNQLKFVTADTQASERLSSRTVVLENLDSSVSKKELLLELSKYARVNQLIFPEVYQNGKIVKTSDVLRYIDEQKHTFGSDMKIEIIEREGDDKRIFTAYESPGSLSEELYLNKSKGLDYIKSFSVETFEEVRKMEEEEAMRKLLREKNKIVIQTIKDVPAHIETDKSNKDGHSHLSNKLWAKFDDGEKLNKIKTTLGQKKPQFRAHKVLPRNDDSVLSSTTSAGFAAVEFASSFEAKKALIGFKAQSRFAQVQVDLWSPGKLFRLVPELKAKMIETIEQNNMMRDTRMGTGDVDAATIFQNPGQTTTNHPEAVKFLRKQHLKESLKGEIDAFVTKSYYTDSPNIETKLPGLDELSHHMLREGRSYGETRDEHEYNILKARVGLAYQKGSYKADAIEKIRFLTNIQRVI